MATLEHTLLIGDILKIDDIYKILQFFAENMEFEGPFRTANISSMLEIASIVSKYDIDLKRKYFLSCSPAPISSPYIEAIFHSYRLILKRRALENWGFTRVWRLLIPFPSRRLKPQELLPQGQTFGGLP